MKLDLEQVTPVRVGIIIALVYGGIILGLLLGYSLGYHHGSMDMLLLEQF